MSTNPFTPPTAEVSDVQIPGETRYVGFWPRVGAALIDTFFLILVTFPLLIAIYGWTYFHEDSKHGLYAGPADALINWILPALISIGFWLTKQATPGKMIVSAKVVDAKTGGKLSVGQSIGRYLGYFVSMLPLGLGIFWVAFDKRKQGWHDKLAGTVVVRR
ncbi:RDD family protein [Aquabacterium sp.]|uniref:RDD family protein n=1 Tax=Aquabacterium sp. TaxID=1872578 RepID=UPI003D6CC9A1